MKKLALLAINTYQIIISPLLRQISGVSVACRYSPTCSEYAKEKIKERGVIVGSRLALRRLLSCHPFSKPTH